MLVIGSFGRLSKLLEIKSVEVWELSQKVDHIEQQLEMIEDENIVLAVQAKEVKAVQLSEDQIKKLLGILIPKKKDQERFMAILKCENGTHQPDRVNVNKDGSIDLGLSQINNRWHKKRVEEMFNQSFEEAMKQPVNNLVYAAYLYKESGNFHLWACDRLVANK